MADEQTFVIRFEDETPADAGVKAVQLRDALLDVSPDVRVSVVKDDQSTQDFGATVVLILGTEAALAIAKGIADYLSRVGATVTIRNADGQVIMKNIKGSDAAHIVEALRHRK